MQGLVVNYFFSVPLKLWTVVKQVAVSQGPPMIAEMAVEWKKNQEFNRTYTLDIYLYDKLTFLSGACASNTIM